MIRFLLGVTVTLAISFGIIQMIRSDERAMTKCQKTHSYEVCLHELQ